MKIVVRVLLPIFLLVYISYETLLKLNNSSLCEASGCQLAAQLLRFDAIYLNFIGIFGLTLLAVVGFKSLKNDSFTKIFNILLYSALTFEATLFLFQIIVNGEPCIFCLGVVTSLLAIAILNNKESTFIPISTVASIFLALNLLTIPTNSPTITATGNYLIESPSCEKVKHYFNDNNIEYTPISIHNPNSVMFLKFLNISSVPALIIKDNSTTQITIGKNEIISLFKEDSTEPILSNASVMDDNFLTQGGNDGCAIAIVPKPCKDAVIPFEVGM